MKKKFHYTCKKCGNRQIIAIDTNSYQAFKIICKRCGSTRLVYHNSGAFKHSVDPEYTSKYTYNKKKLESPLEKSLMLRFLDMLENFMDMVSNIFPYGYGNGIKKFLFVFMGLVGIWILIVGIFFIASFLLFDVDRYLLGLNKNQPNVILDRNEKVIAELFDQKISSLEYTDIPQQMIHILLFIEDEDFFSHGAIDYIALTRAMFKNLISLRYVQGASTITQQLARILLNKREKTITRKLKEALIAFELEERCTKEEILTFYMNHVYLGHGAYGFENAARFYFRKPLKDLNFVQMLVLACLPSRPEFYSPLRNFNHLEKKMDRVFQRMQEEKPDFFRISKETYQKQKQQLRAYFNRSPYETVYGTRTDYAPYVTEFVRSRIASLFGKSFTVSRGLKIYTTIDLDLQISASRESREYLQKIRKYHPYKVYLHNQKIHLQKYYIERGFGGVLLGLPVPALRVQQLETASIGMDPHTGEILFMQGGSEFQPNNQFNRSIQMRRQTGSAIKPIIYSAGIEEGILNPATIFEDNPLYFPLKQANRDYWLPENIDETYEGRISLREALVKSRNIPALIAAQKIGLERLAIQFRKFFFHTDSIFQKRFKNELGIAIGILEMSPLEMAVAYSAFANNGIIRRPYLIRKIEDNLGNILYTGGEDEFHLQMPEEKKVLSGDVAEVMIDLLKSSATHGGTRRGGFFSPRLAGKTGTTNQYRDAWFIGILPDLVISVWVGFDDLQASMNRGTGSGVAGPLYGRIVRNVRNQYDVGEYHFEPRAIHEKICPKSGKLPNPYCPTRKIEIFPLNGTPEEECDYHKPIHRELLPPEDDFE